MREILASVIAGSGVAAAWLATRSAWSWLDLAATPMVAALVGATLVLVVKIGWRRGSGDSEPFDDAGPMFVVDALAAGLVSIALVAVWLVVALNSSPDWWRI